MNIKEMNQVMKWLHEGTLQYKIGQSDWIDFSENSPSIFYPKDDFKIYRRKPTPTLRPWRPEEVPVGAIVSCDSKHTNRFVITGIWNGELHLNGAPCAASHEPSPALKCLVGPGYHYSLDHGKTWLPCGVPVE